MPSLQKPVLEQAPEAARRVGENIMSYEADGSYSRYAKTRRKARKEHLCDACDNVIKPGHYYMRIYTVFDGCSDTIIRCGSCETTHVHLTELCRESDDDMWPSERLDCGESYKGHWEREPPPEIAALPFLIGDDVGALLAPPPKPA